MLRGSTSGERWATKCPSLPSSFLGSALKVPHPGNPHSPGKTGELGGLVTPSPRERLQYRRGGREDARRGHPGKDGVQMQRSLWGVWPSLCRGEVI